MIGTSVWIAVALLHNEPLTDEQVLYPDQEPRPTPLALDCPLQLSPRRLRLADSVNLRNIENDCLYM
jgi:hypothetical protein